MNVNTTIAVSLPKNKIIKMLELIAKPNKDIQDHIDLIILLEDSEMITVIEK